MRKSSIINFRRYSFLLVLALNCIDNSFCFTSWNHAQFLLIFTNLYNRISQKNLKYWCHNKLFIFSVICCDILFFFPGILWHDSKKWISYNLWMFVENFVPWAAVVFLSHQELMQFITVAAHTHSVNFRR